MKPASTRSGASEKLPAGILCAGGDPYVSQVPIRFLISCGFEVSPAISGEEAWSLFEARKGKFDVVIADHDIPSIGDMDGIGLVAKLRFVCYPGIIVVCSASVSLAEIERYALLGFNRILRKPVELWDLLESLSKLTSIR
jgi:CheY-like chemotaxis protein